MTELILQWLNVMGLVLDSFRGHVTERVETKVNEDSDLLVIASRMTKVSQHLAVTDRPFKVDFWRLYNQSMTTTTLTMKVRVMIMAMIALSIVIDSDSE